MRDAPANVGYRAGADWWPLAVRLGRRPPPQPAIDRIRPAPRPRPWAGPGMGL